MAAAHLKPGRVGPWGKCGSAGQYSLEGKAGVQPGPSRDPAGETALDLRSVRPFPPEMAITTLSSSGLGRLQRQWVGSLTPGLSPWSLL